MSQVAALLAQSQTFHSALFPATIKIGTQTYVDDVTTSGLKSGQDMAQLFGGVAQRTISFRLPLAAFEAAGQQIPHATEPLECTAPAAHAGHYTISDVLADPAGVNLTLRCTAPAQ